MPKKSAISFLAATSALMLGLLPWPLHAHGDDQMLIDALTDPVSHDGSADDALDVIIPTTPGFGLSAPLTEHWDSARTARAYSALMRELGYRSWGVHGGDVGWVFMFDFQGYTLLGRVSALCSRSGVGSRCVTGTASRGKLLTAATASNV